MSADKKKYREKICFELKKGLKLNLFKKENSNKLYLAPIRINRPIVDNQKK